MYFPNFDKLLGIIGGNESELGGRPISVVPIGNLFLPSGEIVACDALAQFEALPFTRRLEAGRYPVFAAIDRKEGIDERIACTFLRIGAMEPRRWEMAVTPGKNTGSLPEDGYFGYPVDSGTGCFESAEAHRALRKKMRDDESYWNKIHSEMQKNYKHTRYWADFLIDASTGLNAIVFSSGLGDGSYASYWGFDDASNVCMLLTDFGVI